MQRLAIGIVARPHGVRGEVRVNLHDPGSTSLLRVRRVFVGGVAHTVTSARPGTGALLLKLVGTDDRDAAALLRGKVIEVERRDLPLAEGEFFLADLPGCEVVDAAGRSLGRIVEIMHGAQDILVVRDERVERLVPFIAAWLLAVDMTARRLTIDVPEDLPEEPLAPRAAGR
jgi:16S rRNA processing protein RimM